MDIPASTFIVCVSSAFGIPNRLFPLVKFSTYQKSGLFRYFQGKLDIIYLSGTSFCASLILQFLRKHRSENLLLLSGSIATYQSILGIVRAYTPE